MRFFRRPRYSLKALLVFTLVASLPCWYISVKMARKRRERGAVAALRDSGGWAWYDWEYSRSPELAKPPGPAWLRWVLGDDFFADVDVLLITRECTEGVILRVLDELTEVQRIEISCCEVTEEMAC
ncbi:MAG TPA: hypothetical protein VGX78_14990, partial [Pirellulales bacterium]|nr:hypothetical protein [Pirellulales bacterium]